MFLPHFADYKPTAPMRYGWLTSLTLYPHDELLLVCVEVGIVGLALYVGGLAALCRSHLRQAESEGGGDRLAGWTLFAAFLAMSVHGLFSVALRYWAPSAMYWTLIGMMAAFPYATRMQTAAGKKMPGAVAIWRRAEFVLVLAVVCAAWWGVVWSGAKAEWLMRGAVSGREIMPAEYVDILGRAARLSRYVPDHLVAVRRRAGALRRMGRLDDAIGEYERLERIAPGYGPLRRILAALYIERARSGSRVPAGREMDMRRAAELVHKALKQYPYDAKARMLKRELKTENR